MISVSKLRNKIDEMEGNLKMKNCSLSEKNLKFSRSPKMKKFPTKLKSSQKYLIKSKLTQRTLIPLNLFSIKRYI